MTGEPSIRRATAADAPAVGEVTERAYRVDGYLDAPGAQSYAAALREARTRVRDAVVLVAELEGAVVATVTLAPFGTPYAETATAGELEIRMLAVAPEVRRRGIAVLLMDAAMVHARERGHSRVVLSTEVPMHAAHRLYERLGYRRLPERDWEIEGFRLLGYGRELDLRAGRPDRSPR